MFAIVIPVKNEAARISKTLDNCKYLAVDVIIPVINGCTDLSKNIIQHHSLKNRIRIINFTETLGIDIPRAIGAAYAYQLNSQGVLFLDGDMTGDISIHLNKLINGIVNDKLDMALTNCYPYIYNRTSLANTVLSYRERLNRRLGAFSDLGLANPSHGPHAVSRKLLEKLPWYTLAVPPLSLAMAFKYNLHVKVATSIPHDLLLSPLRNDKHGISIAETIIGDCLEAICFLDGLPPSRKEKGTLYLGYHPERRFDLLEKFIKSLRLK